MKNNYFIRFIVVLLCILNCGKVFGDTDKLSLDEVMALFYQRNLDLIAAQYNLEQSHADQIIAAAIPNPNISIQVSELSKNANLGATAIGCNPDPHVSCGYAQNYSFSQLLEIAGKRGLRMESSGFASLAAENDFRDAIRIFSNLVRGAYYDLLQVQKNRWLIEEISHHYDETAKINQLRLKTGEISESDFLRVRIEALHAHSDMDSAQKAVKQAQAKLALLLRWPAKNLKFEAKEQWPEFQNMGQNNDEEDLIKTALEQRPDLQANKQRVEQFKKQLELARREIYPDVTVNAGYARDPSNNNLNSFFVGVNVPVPLFYQYQGEADKSAVHLNQAQLAVEQTELNIRSDVVDALAAWNSADKIVQRFETSLLNDAKIVRDSSESAFRKGSSSAIEFIEAQRTYKTAMRDYYDAVINRTKAYFDLLKSIGFELTDKVKIGQNP